MGTITETQKLLTEILGNYTNEELKNIADIVPKDNSALGNLNDTIKLVIEEFNKIITLVIDITNKVNQLEKVISTLETEKKELQQSSKKRDNEIANLDKQLKAIRMTITTANIELNKVKDGKETDSKVLTYVDETLNKLLEKNQTVSITNLDTGAQTQIPRQVTNTSTLTTIDVAAERDSSRKAACAKIKQGTYNTTKCPESAPCYQPELPSLNWKKPHADGCFTLEGQKDQTITPKKGGGKQRTKRSKKTKKTKKRVYIKRKSKSRRNCHRKIRR